MIRFALAAPAVAGRPAAAGGVLPGTARRKILLTDFRGGRIDSPEPFYRMPRENTRINSEGA
jgi:hypothetical protein